MVEEAAINGREIIVNHVVVIGLEGELDSGEVGIDGRLRREGTPKTLEKPPPEAKRVVSNFVESLKGAGGFGAPAGRSSSVDPTEST